MKEKRLIILFSRYFSPANTGFANAATGLAECISELRDYELIVITHSSSVPGESIDLPDVSIIRTWEKGGPLEWFLRSHSLQQALHRLKLGWLIYWIAENRQFKLSKSLLQREDLHAVIFETNTYPFIGKKVIRAVPNKTIIRLHAAEDTEELAYGGIQSGGLLKRFRFHIKQRQILEFSKKCRYVVATNRYYLDFFKDVLMDGNVYNIWNKYHYGILSNTLNNYVDKVNDTQIHSEHQVPAKYCLTLGRLNEAGWLQKGFDDLLKAIGLLQQKNCLPKDFHLVIVGDGDHKKKLHKLIDRYDLAQNITHITKTSRNETASLIAHAKYIVLPSRFEGQSMFLTESLALGAPILTTENTGASDMVEHNVNGLLFKCGDHRDLANTICKIEAKSNAEIVDFGQRSKQLYQERFSHEAIKQQLQEILNVVEANS